MREAKRRRFGALLTNIMVSFFTIFTLFLIGQEIAGQHNSLPASKN
jgi:hypothetical protein